MLSFTYRNLGDQRVAWRFTGRGKSRPIENSIKLTDQEMRNRSSHNYQGECVSIPTACIVKKLTDIELTRLSSHGEKCNNNFSAHRYFVVCVRGRGRRKVVRGMKNQDSAPFMVRFLYTPRSDTGPSLPGSISTRFFCTGTMQCPAQNWIGWCIARSCS